MNTNNLSLMLEVNKPKSNLIHNSFSTLFPGVISQWKNTQGIYNDVDLFIVKRSVCFSNGPVDLNSSVLPIEFTDRFRSPYVWGLCGVDSTRANKVTDSKFILCNKPDEHLVAVAIVSFSPDPNSKTALALHELDTDEGEMKMLLERMRREKKNHYDKVRDKKAKKNARRENEDEETETLPSKRNCVRVVEPDDNPSYQSPDLVEDTPYQPSDPSSQSFEPFQLNEFSSGLPSESIGPFELDRWSDETERTSSYEFSLEERCLLYYKPEEQSNSYLNDGYDSGNTCCGPF